MSEIHHEAKFTPKYLKKKVTMQIQLRFVMDHTGKENIKTRSLMD